MCLGWNIHSQYILGWIGAPISKSLKIQYVNAVADLTERAFLLRSADRGFSKPRPNPVKFIPFRFLLPNSGCPQTSNVSKSKFSRKE